MDTPTKVRKQRLIPEPPIQQDGYLPMIIKETVPTAIATVVLTIEGQQLHMSRRERPISILAKAVPRDMWLMKG